MGHTDIYPSAPTLEYQQDDSNIFCISSLASEFFLFRETVAAKAIAGETKASLVCQSNFYPDIIKFYNTIILEMAQNKG